MSNTRRTGRPLTPRVVLPLLQGRAGSSTPPRCQPVSQRGVMRKLCFRDDSEQAANEQQCKKRQRCGDSPSSVAPSSLSRDSTADGSQNSEVSSASVFRRCRSTSVPRTQVVLVTRNLRLRCDAGGAASLSGARMPLCDDGRQPSVSSGPPTVAAASSHDSVHGGALAELSSAAEQSFVKPFRQFLQWSSGLLNKGTELSNPLQRPPLSLALPGSSNPAMPAAFPFGDPADAAAPSCAATAAVDQLSAFDVMLQCIAAAEKRACDAGQAAL